MDWRFGEYGVLGALGGKEKAPWRERALGAEARRRAKALGLQRASGVHLVSAHTGMGTTVLAEQLEQRRRGGAEGREERASGQEGQGREG